MPFTIECQLLKTLQHRVSFVHQLLTVDGIDLLALRTKTTWTASTWTTVTVRFPGPVPLQMLPRSAKKYLTYKLSFWWWFLSKSRIKSPLYRNQRQRLLKSWQIPSIINLRHHFQHCVSSTAGGKVWKTYCTDVADCRLRNIIFMVQFSCFSTRINFSVSRSST